MPKTNMTMAAVSDDRSMLDIFEQLALAAGREVMRVFHAGCEVDRGRSREHGLLLMQSLSPF